MNPIQDQTIGANEAAIERIAAAAAARPAGQARTTVLAVLTEEQTEQTDDIAQMASLVGGLVGMLMQHPGTDKRWVSIAATDLQKGFMSLTRSVTQPTTF